MSSLYRRVAPYVTALLTSSRTRSIRRQIAERRRAFAGEPHRVHYFHQVDDPYSHLAAQLLGRLTARYDVELCPHLVDPPSDAAAPERARLDAFARRDAADVAPGYGLVFPEGAAAPAPDDVILARRILVASIAGGTFTAAAVDVGSALWSGDRARLERLADAFGSVSADEAGQAARAGSEERTRRGHYLGATFHYGGEWYWGVDRLHHLERRLMALGLRRPDGSTGFLAPRPSPELEPAPHAQERLVVEFFLSLRSPYTCIAMERTLALAHRLPVELRLRPVLPMVMRGLPVPREKQLYIVLDTRREAEDIGVPFGRVCDPVGRPIERCFSLLHWARAQGREAELLHAFVRAAFAEGVDTGSDTGMRHVVEQAGLPWSEATQHLDRDTAWRDELEQNRTALFASGLWGVPSYRLLGRPGESDFSTWGQDRLWRLEQEIRKRLAA